MSELENTPLTPEAPEAPGTPEMPEEGFPFPDLTDGTPEAGDGAPEAPAENPLQAELDAAKALADEYLAMAQRVQADFDNFRKRNAGVRAESYADGQRSVARDMLDVLDNLERALALAEPDSPLGKGLALTLKQMNGVYEKLGVTAIDRLGEKFDPNLENAVMQGTPEEGEPGTVCQVLQKGYRAGDHVLRHAMVRVVAE